MRRPTGGRPGRITWQKTIATTGTNVSSEADTLTVSLQASPGQQALPPPVYTDGCPPPSNVCNTFGPTSVALFGRACPVPGYRSLGAGTVTMQGPGLSPAQVPLIPLQQGPVSGLSVYQAMLPAGTVQAGDFTVAANGGSAFQAAAPVGADIQIQTPLAGINVFGSCQPLTIGWTSGDPKSWVTVSFVLMEPIGQAGSQATILSPYHTRTSNGTLTIPLPDLPGAGCGTVVTPVQLVIEVDPDPSEIARFTASGLSLGGQVNWRYIHTFQANLEME